MRISSIPQIYRHVNRWREILAVLSKYGLAGWVTRLGIPFTKGILKSQHGERLAGLAPEVRLRMALEELGPTFIKFGQLLSTRPDVVGFELAGELAKLQGDVAADDFASVKSTLESELGRTISEVFAEFAEEPVASASIGQVHRGRLADGREVAVKVQHAQAAQRARADLEIMTGLAQLAERLPELASYRPSLLASEFRRTMRHELDFTRERRYLERFAKHFDADPRVRIPRSIGECSSRRVLTMQWIEGVPLQKYLAAGMPHSERAKLAVAGAQVYLEMLFEHGLYHADPHAGNFLMLPDGRFGLLDFGMVGRLDDALREQVEEMLLAVVDRDAPRLAAVVIRLGSVGAEVDQVALTRDLGDFVDDYAHEPLASFNLSGALTDLLELLRRYQVALPGPIAMVVKVLVMLEGLARQLDPEFCLMKVIEPYRLTLTRRRFSPARQLRRVKGVAGEVERLVEIAPRRIREILDQVQSGRFDVHLDHRGLEPSVNRLVLGLLTSALFLGSSVLTSQKVWPVGDVSAPGVIGMLMSLGLGVRLLWAIGKSGHLDRQQ